MFHVGMWRERMRNALTEMSEDRPYTPPPEDLDDFNNAELPNGIGTPLSDAAARSDHLLGEIIKLYAQVGERPMTWYRSRTTTEAVLVNSYIHPRVHMYEYLRENGELGRANRLLEDAEAQMRAMEAPALQLSAAIYNLACARCSQGRLDEAIKGLKEAFEIRPELKKLAVGDSDLVAIHNDPRFKELVADAV